MKRLAVLTLLACAGGWSHAQDAAKSSVRDIGGRRELFVDDFLIERLQARSVEDA